MGNYVYSSSRWIPFTPWGPILMPGGWVIESSVPSSFSFINKLELEAQEKDKVIGSLINLVRERLQSQKKLLVSSVRDLREDRPADFLQIGCMRSRAVCRIARYFSHQDFQIFIEKIEQSIAKTGSAEAFDSIAKLKEIFLIPDKIADEIFSRKVKNDKEVLNEVTLKIVTENQESTETIAPEKIADKISTSCSLAYSKILLDELKNLTEEQLAKINPIPVGSGFLVGATHLLTNYHVLFDEEVANQCVAQFNYEEALGVVQKTIDYELDPDTLFIREPSLDYALVQLKFDKLTRQAGHHFGWIQLVEDDSNIIPSLDEEIISKLKSENFKLSKEETEGDNVILIHHAKGRLKKIESTNNRVIKGGLYKSFLRYTAESDYGSSGCPVFNTKWELVALNHAAIPQADEKTFVKQGIRICQIVADLKQKSASSPKLKSFIEDFVVTSEQLVYPALPAALEFDGERSYVDCGTDKRLTITQAITVEAWVKNNDPSSDGFIVYRGGSFEQTGYCIWRYANKIRVELQDNSHRKIIVDTDNIVLDDQDWHHVAFTWDKNDVAKDAQKDGDSFTKIAGVMIFFDGKIQPIISTPSKDASNFGDISNTNESLTIGRSENIESTIDNLLSQFKNNPVLQGYFKRPNANLRLTIARQYYFNGSIAEVRLWNVARTPDQIKNNRRRRLGKYDKDWSAGLVGYWRPEEVVDNRVYNLKRESLSPPPISSCFDPLNFGLRLHGLVEYVDCGKLNYGKEITALTVEAWVKNMGGESDGMIVHQGGGWNEDGFSIWRFKGKLRVELQNQGKKIIFDSDNHLLSDSTFYHVAFTWEKVSGVKIYINGKNEKCQGSKDLEHDLFSDSVGVPKVNLNIGRSQNYGRYFNGIIAEVRIWNIARTPDQIQQNMCQELSKNSEPQWSNLVGYWRLDEDKGDRAANLVSDDQYGVVFARRWEKAYKLLEGNQGAYGVVSKAQIIKASQYPASPLPFGLMFNESDHCVQCDFQNSSIKVIDGITVEAWIKHKFGNCLIVKRSDDHQYEYSLAWYEGKIRVKLQANQEKIVVYTEECFPNDHLWHHVAFTWGKDEQGEDSHEISIYVDGRLQNCVVEGNCKTLISTMQARSIGLFEGSLKSLEKDDIPLKIGCKEKGTDYYNIEIAEVRLWNVARTQDQIQKNMSCRLSRQDSEQDWLNLVGYWRLDEISEDGTLAFDQSDNQNHGTIAGAPRFPTLPLQNQKA